MRKFTEYPPLSLYVHFPWCVRKCPYCDFNSHTAPDQIPERTYLNAVISDLELHAPDIWGRPVESIFLGGGTPSLISEDGLDFLLGKIRSLVRLVPEAEITLEANPGTVEQARFRAYRQCGVNRLSIGVQSFDDDALKKLGRIHGSQDAVTACQNASEVGFDNFNIDLMHGLPNQSVTCAATDVSMAISLRPAHISYYQLTLEPNTLFAARPPHLPSENTLWEIQQTGKSLLADAGYEQYEISAYARTKKQCQHNLNYWLFGDYLGIGAGAHSKLTFPAHECITRIAKHKHPTAYIAGSGSEQRIQERHNVDHANTRVEFLMNALRLNNGFTHTDFLLRTGEPITVIIDEIQQAEEDDLLLRRGDHIKPTALGLRYLDSLLEKFLSPDPHDTVPNRKVIPIRNEISR